MDDRPKMPIRCLRHLIAAAAEWQAVPEQRRQALLKWLPHDAIGLMGEDRDSLITLATTAAAVAGEAAAEALDRALRAEIALLVDGTQLVELNRLRIESARWSAAIARLRAIPDDVRRELKRDTEELAFHTEDPRASALRAFLDIVRLLEETP